MKNILKTILLSFGLLATSSFAAADDHLVASPKEQKVLEAPMQVTLYSLISQRLELSEKLATSYWNEKTPIDDLKKEEAFIKSIEAKAAHLGLDSKDVTSFFTAQMDASKMICIENFEVWVKNDHHKHKNCAEASTIETQIEAIDAQILEQLTQSKDVLNDKQSLKTAITKDLQVKGFSREVIDSATQF